MIHILRRKKKKIFFPLLWHAVTSLGFYFYTILVPECVFPLFRKPATTKNIHFLTFLLNIVDSAYISMPRDYFKQHWEQFKCNACIMFWFIFYTLWKILFFLNNEVTKSFISCYYKWYQDWHTNSLVWCLLGVKSKTRHNCKTQVTVWFLLEAVSLWDGSHRMEGIALNARCLVSVYWSCSRQVTPLDKWRYTLTVRNTCLLLDL